MKTMRVMVLTAASGLCLWGGWGCSGSQVGPSLKVDPDGTVASRNAEVPNKVVLARRGQTWMVESATPGTYTEMFDKNGNALASIGPKSRMLVLPWFGEEVKIASDADVELSVKEACLPDGTSLKGLTLSTKASPTVLAQNDALARWAKVVLDRDAASAQTLLADTAAVQSIVSALGPPALEILRALALGG